MTILGFVLVLAALGVTTRLTWQRIHQLDIDHTAQKASHLTQLSSQVNEAVSHLDEVVSGLSALVTIFTAEARSADQELHAALLPLAQKIESRMADINEEMAVLSTRVATGPGHRIVRVP